MFDGNFVFEFAAWDDEGFADTITVHAPDYRRAVWFAERELLQCGIDRESARMYPILECQIA